MSATCRDDEHAGRPSALAALPAETLREVMRSRLHGRPSIGPPVDPRVETEAFEWLSDEFRLADAPTQRRMTAILRSFLDELTDVERWPQDARCELLDLIQDCGDDLVDDLFRLIRQRTFLDAKDLGPDAHAGLLKCLISNGNHATPEFWLEQSGCLGPAYGALIFSGLADHGLELAMRHLPELSSDDEARQYIRWLFPHLENEHGNKAVLDALDRQRSRLPEETYRLYREDLGAPIAAKSTPAAPLDLVQRVRSARSWFGGRQQAFPGLLPT